jgi:hypothetical protein
MEGYARPDPRAREPDLLGLIRFDPVLFVVGIAAALAGTVFFGSSQNSLEGILAKIQAYEARRTEMINAMDLRTVHDG